MDKVNLIKGVQITPLKIISHQDGDIFHILKKTDDGFNGFGEAYISTVRHGAIKAWKMHKTMICNFAVPVGRVKVVVCECGIAEQIIQEFILSTKDYYRLTVSPGLWYGFEGIDAGINMLVNIANIPHDPLEQVNEPREKSIIKYNW